MNCPAVINELKAYIDGELGPVTRWRVARHLARCAACRQEAKMLTDLSSELQNIHGTPAPDGLREKVLGRITFQPAAKRPKFKPYLVPGAAAAAVLLIIALVYPMLMTAKEVRVAQGKAVVAQRVAVPQTGAARPMPLAEPMPKAKVARDYDLNLVPRPSSPSQSAPTANATIDLNDYRKYSRTWAPATPSPLIIKSADIAVQVRDFQRANDAATLIAKSSGGYVTDSSAESDAGTPSSGTLTIKVPVQSFERAVSRLGELGKVTSKSISGEDVSGEVVDLESRLRNKRAEERQYLEIMNKAHRVNDIVTVSNELYRVRGEIEEMMGRIKYLRSSAAMSTINLTLSEKARSKKPVPVSGIHQSFNNAIASMGRTLSSLASLTIWLAVYSPLWVLAILGAVYYRRRAATQG